MKKNSKKISKCGKENCDIGFDHFHNKYADVLVEVGRFKEKPHREMSLKFKIHDAPEQPYHYTKDYFQKVYSPNAYTTPSPSLLIRIFHKHEWIDMTFVYKCKICGKLKCF